LEDGDGRRGGPQFAVSGLRRQAADVALDLPVPPVEVALQQLRLGLVANLGDTDLPAAPPRPHLDDADFGRLREEFDFSGDDSAVAKCFLLWAGLVGAISLEVFGQYGADTLTDPEAVFDLAVRLLVETLTA
jgi:hypothetical protein